MQNNSTTPQTRNTTKIVVMVGTAIIQDTCQYIVLSWLNQFNSSRYSWEQSSQHSLLLNLNER